MNAKKMLRDTSHDYKAGTPGFSRLVSYGARIDEITRMVPVKLEQFRV